jgi:hypothetical protein
MPASALSRFVQSIKDEDRASHSIGDTLKKILDDYTGSREFQQYCSDHAEDAAKYLKKQEGERQGRWRASSAGKCVQAQAFDVVLNELAEKLDDHDWFKEARTTNPLHVPLLYIEVVRPARQVRALDNGTFGHVRWHMVFDALHEKGIVTTLFAEELRYYPLLQLSGTCDRVVEFKYGGKMVRAVIDFKTIKTRYFTTLIGPQRDNAAQQHAYDLMGFGADVFIMLYECKDDQELKLYDRPYDPDLIATMDREYKLANRWVDQLLEGRKPDVELPLETSWCSWCPWNKTCAKLHPDRPDLVKK